jgi:hypothetical protein
MDTKLTLNINADIIKQVKLYSRKQGRSLSDLVENYFKMLSGKMSFDREELTPKVKSLLGSFNLPEDFDFKKELSDQLRKKYL